MKNDEYTNLVEKGKYPEDPTVPIDHSFVNENGEIKNILLQSFTSVAIIHSKIGSIRANHYHKTDWHYSYILKGLISYLWRPVGLLDKPKMINYSKNTMFFTPPMVEHAMFFPVESTFITFAKNRRDHENHESDLVRVKLADVIFNKEKKQYQLRY